MNILVPVIFLPRGSHLRNGIAVSKDMCIFYLDGYCQIPLHRSYTLMNNVKVYLFPPYFLQNMLVLNFTCFDILTREYILDCE